ncbi:cyclodeaminase/cyclohydrolase family protein [Atopococcus tabaci]|uniref:cyclodeaminase/cyclohydrolase family protein n=1 Tax=Atopococcus tabaci TaxID=269774 RepID=UPI00240A8B5B|nr:cyclodeaminase/cyclohydrolase family protein [Atopococcus tabaci]
MEEQTIRQYLEELGRKEGKPGGGSAAALVGAMSASLAQMVADIEKNKKKHQDHREQLIDILEEAGKWKERLEQLSAEDAEAFEPVVEAYKMPKDTDEEKKLRSQKIEEGLNQAAQPPLETMEVVQSVLHLYRRLAEHSVAGSIVSDIAVGVLFCRTTLEAAWLNVLVNARGMKDGQQKEVLLKKGKQLLKDGRHEAENVYEATTIYLETGKWPASSSQSGGTTK